MSEIDIDRIAAVAKMFRQFPANQGKRPKDRDAKTTLNSGAPPQSAANADKKLGHVDTASEVGRE